MTSQFGQVRFVYNYFLRQRIDHYIKEKKGLHYFDMVNMLVKLKQQPEYDWLKESNAQALQMSLRHLDTAYNNFFNKKFRFPKFKKKDHKQSFCVPQHFSFDEKHHILYIPKMTPIKIIFHQDMEGKAKNVTICKTTTGKYFASVLCEIEKNIKSKKDGSEIGSEIGIDLGLKSFLVDSNGKKVKYPKFLRKSEKKLKKAQRVLSRRIKGSNRRDKARHKVAIIYEQITNQRNDFLHKLSHQLVSENQAIFAEDLNVKGILTNHRLAKSVSDASWSEFMRQIKYKSEWNGVCFKQIDRFFPSSKRCNNCGWINESLVLSDRKWKCKECGQIVDRDHNAAKNILQFGKLSMVRQGMSKPLKRSGRLRAVRRVDELRNHTLRRTK
jgi:putative transposase